VSHALRDLGEELDRWQAIDRPVHLWMRDDDAIAPSPGLDRLAALAERFHLPVLLAVIPMLASPALAVDLATKPLLLPCQHGAWHCNHAAEGAKKSEFGVGRPRAAAQADLRQGWQRLSELFGPGLLPVFVPPWNRIDPDLASRLPELGFTGLSCFRGFRLAGTGDLALANTDLDIMDWQGGRIGRSVEAMAAELVGTLASRREAGGAETMIGLLLHHRDHDTAGWLALERLLAVMTAHPAIRPTDPQLIFAGAVASRT
jgi:hypothetical protein